MSAAVQTLPSVALLRTWTNKASLLDSGARTLRVSIVRNSGDEELDALATAAAASTAALLAALQQRAEATP